MRLVGYDRAPARLPRGSGAPATSPEALADRARDLLAAPASPRSSAGRFVPRGLAAPLGGRALRGRGREEPDLRGLRGDAHVAASGPASTRPSETSPAASPTSVSSRSGPSSGAGRTTKDEPQSRPTRRRSWWADVPGWLRPGEPLDFFDVKRVATELLRGLGVSAPTFVPRKDSVLLHPGAGASIYAGESTGVASDRSARSTRASPARWGSTSGPSTSRCVLDVVSGVRRPIRSAPPPRFPAVTRDISFWIDVGRERRRPACVADVDGRAVAARTSRCSRTIAIHAMPRRARRGCCGRSPTARGDRTLTDAEVDAAHARVVEALKALPVGVHPLGLSH